MTTADKLGAVCLVCAILIAFLFGMLIGCAIQDGPAYKQGQLDYQAGKIEWCIIDGRVHHIEGEK